MALMYRWQKRLLLGGAMGLALLGAAPVMAQVAPDQQCSGQSCGLYLQSTQSAQTQAPSQPNPTPLQPATQGLVSPNSSIPLQLSGNDPVSMLAGEADTQPPSNTAPIWPVAVAAALILLMAALIADAWFLGSRLLIRLVVRLPRFVADGEPET